MRTLHFLTLALALLAFDAASAGERIEEQMTLETFRATGLDKLTAEELDRLNDWLRGRLKRVEEAARASAAPAEPPAEIRSRIDGDFAGWDGDTVFRLKNGQVWEQRTGGRWRHRARDPEVVITRNLLGFYRMELVDEGRSVGVRLKGERR